MNGSVILIGVTVCLWQSGLGVRSRGYGPLMFFYASYRVFPRLEGSKFNSLTIG